MILKVEVVGIPDQHASVTFVAVNRPPGEEPSSTASIAGLIPLDRGHLERGSATATAGDWAASCGSIAVRRSPRCRLREEKAFSQQDVVRLRHALS